MSLPNVKKFVSATELEEQRKKRQEEWEKVRRPDQPLEAPEEEEVDRRTLYERLQEQKDRKQAEHDEQHKLKNQVRGLDSEEADFLEFVSQRQQELEAERLQEEAATLALLREPVAKPTTSKPVSSEQSAKQPLACPGPKKMTQAEILSRVVKRKRSDAAETSQAKKVKDNSSDEADGSHDSPKAAENVDDAYTEASSIHKDMTPLGDVLSEKATLVPREEAVARVIGILPGIGFYSNSSESDTSSSDSEIDTDLLRRSSVAKDIEKLIQAAHQH